jgi:uncharacterized protein (DUF362 family)
MLQSEGRRTDVAVVYDESVRGYARLAPFHPDEHFLEYPFENVSSDGNSAYRMVRNALYELGLDAGNFGTALWNPLGGLIKPGQHVLLKPNLVSHFNWSGRTELVDTDSLVTHGSVIRAVADYVYIALGGNGRITVGDSPVQATDWRELLELIGAQSIAEYYRLHGLSMEFKDFRLVIAKSKRGEVRSQHVQNDIEDYVEVDLGSASLLEPIIGDHSRFAVSAYGTGRMRRNHNPGRNAYLIPRIVFEADYVINLPKLKSHMKAGLTASLKNTVGINGHKDYLPHFRMGTPREGGDEYLGEHWLEGAYWSVKHLEWGATHTAKRFLLRSVTRVMSHLIPSQKLAVSQGAWFGNDTIWRMILDLNRILFYYDIERGALSLDRRRQPLSIIDGIIGGDHESPLSPSAVHSGCIIAGFDSVIVDCVAAAFMGFDHRRIPTLAHAFDAFTYPVCTGDLSRANIRSNGRESTFSSFEQLGPCVRFEPSHGWRGHVERERNTK